MQLTLFPDQFRRLFWIVLIVNGLGKRCDGYKSGIFFTRSCFDRAPSSSLREGSIADLGQREFSVPSLVAQTAEDKSNVRSLSATDESWDDTISLASKLLISQVFVRSSATSISLLCDQIAEAPVQSRQAQLLRLSRSLQLASVLKRNRTEYLNIVLFFGEKIPRSELPNVQDVPITIKGDEVSSLIGESRRVPAVLPLDDEGYLPDCPLPSKQFSESILDKALMSIFRGLVQKETEFVSEKESLQGLLDEGRSFMLSDKGTEENQHIFVRNTLRGLMTPVLPPFYRIFMAGIVPSSERGDPEWLIALTEKFLSALPKELVEKVGLKPGAQFGPWFYAPALTSLVTPPFLNFLVGPSKPNLKSDGKVGGLLVEKCKFLQESGCKGLCLHQCKLPAQQFFAEELGLNLSVSPNFVTQECQWSWGETPMDPREDPSFPTGCLSGCATRKRTSEKVLSSCG